jgi:hypothetical protein
MGLKQSLRFCRRRLSRFIPSLDPTHVEASGTESAFFFLLYMVAKCLANVLRC